MKRGARREGRGEESGGEESGGGSGEMVEREQRGGG